MTNLTIENILLHTFWRFAKRFERPKKNICLNLYVGNVIL